jgi:hypothetical protein
VLEFLLEVELDLLESQVVLVVLQLVFLLLRSISVVKA